MAKVIVGAIVAAIAMFILGFLFYATPLAGIGSADLADQQAATVQQVLAQNVEPGAGTYHVPNPNSSSAQTSMYGRGPIATIHYNNSGFATTDPASLVGGLVLDFLTMLLVGAALIGIDRRVPDFGSRSRVAMLIAVAASAYIHLKNPLFYHHDWAHSIYAFVADGVTLGVGGLIVAWFLPRAHAATEAPPTTSATG